MSSSSSSFDSFESDEEVFTLQEEIARSESVDGTGRDSTSATHQGIADYVNLQELAAPRDSHNEDLFGIVLSEDGSSQSSESGSTSSPVKQEFLPFPTSHSPEQDAPPLPTSHSPEQDAPPLPTSHSPEQDAPLLPTSHSPEQDAPLLPTSHSPEQDAPPLPTSHYLEQDAPPLPTSHSPEPHAPPLPTSHYLKQDAPPLPTSHYLEPHAPPLPTRHSPEQDAPPLPTSHSPEQDAPPLPTSHYLEQDAPPLPTSHSPEPHAPPLPTSHYLEPHAPPLPTRHSPEQDAPPFPTSHSPEQDAPPFPSSHSPEQDAPPFPTSHSPEQDAPPLPTSHSPEQDAPPLPTSHSPDAYVDPDRVSVNTLEDADKAYAEMMKVHQDLQENDEFDFNFSANDYDDIWSSVDLQLAHTNSQQSDKSVGESLKVNKKDTLTDYVNIGNTKQSVDYVNLENNHLTATVNLDTPDATPTSPSLMNGLPSRLDSLSSSFSLEPEDNEQQTIIVCGKAGSGKNSLVDKMVADSPTLFSKVVQHTTRPPFDYEHDGRDFHFITMDRAEEMIQNREFAEFTFLHPNSEARETYNPVMVKQRTWHNKLGYLKDMASLPTTPSTPTLRSGQKGSSTLFGTSYQSVQAARQKGHPCVVLVLSFEGAWQMSQLGLNAKYILLETASGEASEFLDSLKPHMVLQVGPEVYSILQHEAITYIEKTMPHNDAVYLAVKSSWDAVPEVKMSPTCSRRSGTRRQYTPFVTFAECLQHYQKKNLATELQSIQPIVRYQGMKGVTHKLFGPPQISGRDLKHERDLVFALAQCKLDYSDSFHSNMLQTIYKKVTGRAEGVDCPRFGPHWEQIGFQGSDPATDLRATGLLSLLHLIYLVDSPDRLALAHKVYKLSQADESSFPFCVLSINITRIAMSALREGYLTRECHHEGACITVVSRFYTATLYHYYELYRRQGRSRKEVGQLLHRTELHCKKCVSQVIQQLDEALAQWRKSAASQATVTDPAFKFTSLSRITNST